MSWPYSDDWEYANSRLAETVITHNERPFFVYHVRAGTATGFYLGESIQKTVDAKELDTRPVKLGYVNFNGKCYYLSRIPKRRDWRQGLRRENMMCIPHKGINILSWEVIAPTIIGKYPTFEKCVQVAKTGKQLAWHRQWALSGNSVLYRCEVVGEVVDGKVNLHKEFTYLREALEEVL